MTSLDLCLALWLQSRKWSFAHKLDQWCFYHCFLPHTEETHGWKIWTKKTGIASSLWLSDTQLVWVSRGIEGRWSSRRVKCQNWGRWEGRLREREVARALFLNPLTCGECRLTAYGNFSKCKYALVKILWLNAHHMWITGKSRSILTGGEANGGRYGERHLKEI